MAGAMQSRNRGSAVKTPSAPSDDGTLIDTPLQGTPVDGEDLEQHDGALHSDEAQQEVSVTDEVGPLGANVKEALAIASNLAQLGLNTQEISIPRCVVLGQQSTGKSSVIEAISGIKTPRDTGTCTRVPLFIDMRPSDNHNADWHAEVYLLRQFDLKHPGRGQDTAFPGWTHTSSPGKIPFAKTGNPAQLEEIIACAQRATLSPMVDYKLFLDPSYRNLHMHSTLFSPNPVGISIRKPNLPALSFFDLPGLIGQAETEEEAYTVPLVQNLVSMYVQDPEALVLVTAALENDLATSTAAGLARDLKATTRCIGVLTKPDRLPIGSSSTELAKILEGRRFALGHGYFVVKNLDQKQIKQGVTHSSARQIERQFFQTATPWSDDLQQFQPRFGTINLQHYLSLQLGKQIIAKLPEIRKQIEGRLETVEAELRQIPEAPLHTATRTVCDVLQAFATDVRSEIDGDHGHESWEITWQKLQQAFWTALEQSKPTMKTSGKRDEGIFSRALPGGSSDGAITIEDSSDDMELYAEETPSKKRKHGLQTKRELQTPAPTTPKAKTPKKPVNKTPQVPISAPSFNATNTITGLRKVFNLDEVATHITQSSQGRVAGGLHPKARENMMLSALDHWQTAIDKFFAQLEQQLKQRIQQLFDYHFRNWVGSDLYKESLAIVMSMLDNNLHEQRTVMAAETLSAERLRPYTILDDIFEQDKVAVMARYRDARFKARHKQYLKEAAEHEGCDLSNTAKDRLLKDEKKMALLKTEPYERELSLVADVTTYHMIAARRLVEVIVMRIDDKFFQQLRNKLRDQLQDELNIFDEQRGAYTAQRLLAESPARLEHRRVLEAQRTALLQALNCFEEHYRKFHLPIADMAASNHQRPSVTAPHGEEMESIQAHGLPLRSQSRPNV